MAISTRHNAGLGTSLSTRAAILAFVVSAVAAFSGAATAPTAAAPARDAASSAYVAAILANDARAILGNPDLAPVNAARQAAIILKFAVDLDRGNLRHQHLLAESALAGGMAGDMIELRRQALRSIIKADAADLVAQVDYVDLRASDAQDLDGKAKIFQAVLDDPGLDAQVKSEMAVRLAQLCEARGEIDRTRNYLQQALRHNNINVTALREVARLSAADDSPIGDVNHLKALANLLVVNPYQSDAWLEAGRLCAGANLHDRAADFLLTAFEQAQLDGIFLDGDTLLELVIEQAASGKQKSEAFKNATALAQNPDAPLSALLVAEMLSQDNPTAPVLVPTTQNNAEKWLTTIRTRLAEQTKDVSKENTSTLADAAGIDLTMLPDVGPQTAVWIDEYANRVPADDPTLVRLKGWLNYRQGKLDEARILLNKIPEDPLAQLGLARIFLDEKNKSAAATKLQAINATHPSGLLALQIARTAQKAGIALPDTQRAVAMRDAAAALIPAVVGMHRHTRDVAMMSVTYRPARPVEAGEPIMISVRMTNVTDKPIPVGPNGVVRSSVGIADTTRTLTHPSAGLYVIEDVQRAYRLEPRQFMEMQLRVDQGMLAAILDQDLGSSQTVGISALMAPRLVTGTQYTMAVGGQMVSPGDFDRRGIGPAANDPQALAGELSSSAGVRRLVRIRAAGELLQKKGSEPLRNALVAFAPSTDELMSAAAAHEVTDNAFLTDARPLVRLVAAVRVARSVTGGEDDAKLARAALAKMMETEADASVKTFIATVLELAAAPTTTPATTPATTKP